MLFLSRRFSSINSASSSLSCWVSARNLLTSSLLASRAVSPASRFLPASRKSFDQRFYRFWLMSSLRHSSAMLSSQRRPAITIRIFSSAEYWRRVARRISRTACSASSRMPLHFRSHLRSFRV